MSRRTLLSLLMLFAMILAPAAALAQDGDAEMETYTSGDELLTFSYPAEWVLSDLSEEEMGPPFPFVFLASSQETIDRINMGEPVIAGDHGIMVLVVPLDFLTMTGVTLAEDATQGEVAAAAAEWFWSDEPAPEEGAEEPATQATEEATEEATAEATAEAPMGDLTIGEPEDVEFNDTLTGGAATFSTGTEDGVVFVRELGEGLLGVTVAAAYPGEFGDELRQAAQDVAASVEYTGTADALMAAMMAAPQVGVEPSDVDPATLDGNALIDERCTVCHTRERIDQQDKDEAGWTATVDRMISYGADLDEAERQAVINYLVETH